MKRSLIKPFVTLVLDRSTPKTLQAQLQEHLRRQIQLGTLAAGDHLPSTRDLSSQLSISRNTVILAYEQLISEDYLVARPRMGVRVAASLARLTPQKSASFQSATAKRANAIDHALFPPIPFWPCQPDVSLFPLATWNRIRGRVIRRDGLNLLNYNEHSTMGLRVLRENIAAYLRDSRGVNCDWRQIAITAGSQHAIFLLANVLLKREDKLYIEDPGYNGIKRIADLLGAEVISGDIDEQGLKLPLITRNPISLIYMTPSRQFPTGAKLSLQRRLEFVKYAATMGTWILEDDYDSDFRYRAAPLPSLQSLDTRGKIIYVGTFSKVLFPSLRLGYIVLPEALIKDFTKVKYAMDQHGPMIEQATLSGFIESGALHSHIRKCRRHYAERQKIFLEHSNHLGLPLDFRFTDGGMNLTGFLESHVDDEICSIQLKKADIAVPSLSYYSRRRGDPGLVFGFSAFQPDKIKIHLEKTAHVLSSFLSHS